VEGQDQERIRIATELHEEVGTTLAAISQGLSALEDPDCNDIQQRIKQLHHYRQEINQVIQSIRTLSSELAPKALTELGLRSAIKSYVELVRHKNHDLQMDLDIDAIQEIEPQLSTSIKLSIYRIVVELINNIYDHSYAKSANCSFLLSKNLLNFIVEDDGVGFDPQSDFIGNGFRSIYARLSVLNGSLQIESEADTRSGCFVSVQIPLTTLIS
jgi:signal transduction histidine kinase